jgi:mannan endo-1,4-beta-mannosidase
MASDRRPQLRRYGERMPSSRKRNTLFTLFAIILLAPHLPAQTDAFVQRTGTKLTLNSAPFRYSGPNIE